MLVLALLAVAVVCEAVYLTTGRGRWALAALATAVLFVVAYWSSSSPIG